MMKNIIRVGNVLILFLRMLCLFPCCIFQLCCFRNKSDPKRIRKAIIYGHRIFSDEETPENSLQALDKAKELNIEGIEFDLLMTKDNEMMLMHDSLSMDRVLEIESNIPFHSLTCKEIKEHPFRIIGSEQEEEEEEVDDRRVPTFEEIIRRIDELYENPEDLILAIDAKAVVKRDILLRKLNDIFIEDGKRRKNPDHTLYKRAFVLSSNPLDMIMLKIMNPKIIVLGVYIPQFITLILDNRINKFINIEEFKKRFFCNSETLFRAFKRLSFIWDWIYETVIMMWIVSRFVDGYAVSYYLDYENHDNNETVKHSFLRKLVHKGRIVHAWTINQKDIGEKLLDMGVSIYSDVIQEFLEN